MDLTTSWAGEVLLRFGLTGMKLSRDDGPFVQYKSMSIVDACHHMVATQQNGGVAKSDCEAADTLLVTDAVTGTCFIIFTSLTALCTAATFLVTGTSRFGRLSAMTVEPNRADKAMVHVKRSTAIVAVFIALILSSIISLFPAKVFGKYVCPVAGHALPFVVNTSAANTLPSATGESHHAGASAYLALVACLFFLCACVFILSRMAIVAWCMELCGEVEFEMEYESEDEVNAFDDGHNGGKSDPSKVDGNEGDEGPGGRRARLEGVVVYDPVGMKSHKGRVFDSAAAAATAVDDIVVDSSCAVLADFIRERALDDIEFNIHRRKADERVELGRLHRLHAQQKDMMAQLERQLVVLRERREAKKNKKKDTKGHAVIEGEDNGDDGPTKQEMDCETSLQESKELIALIAKEIECRDEVIEQLTQYEEKLKTVDTIELALNAPPAVATKGGAQQQQQPTTIDLYADPLRVASSVVPVRSEVSVIAKPRAVDGGGDQGVPQAEPFSLILPTHDAERDEKVRIALRSCR
ncbi:hypothetical protein FOL47_008264 [Perkinsus chesapeaki]|uniref:Uncharacterized protein n=1 Tax=Perkinsus chesapeaki TaxID=330153 RepID=A0A7J6MU22_PERCH|nr:hypothetical protein FOL47_008264 [Perkinsus chesapeaki]